MSRTSDDLLYFMNSAIDGMARIVEGLGDDLANITPPIPGANSPYVILTHCLGVCEYWAGHVVAGRTISRDRPAEFRACGRVVDLLELVRIAKEKLRTDMQDVDFAGAAVNPPKPPYEPPGSDLSNGAVLFHVFEELAQHHGHMEITRDLILRDHGER